MRLNRYIALQQGISRRTADVLIQQGKVSINGVNADLGTTIGSGDIVLIDGEPIANNPKIQTIMLNKPVGYVCSRDGQGSKTIYDLLPQSLHHLKPVGRLDKNSSGLLLLTNDGMLAHELTHPSYRKQKKYIVTLDKPLSGQHEQLITHQGVQLDDGISGFSLSPSNSSRTAWKITMQEGRNRQIRRTFAALKYDVTRLHRIEFGKYRLGNLVEDKYMRV